ncbi:MAG: alpha/beta hydrolase [Deltaproteobacteria bacterium]
MRARPALILGATCLAAALATTSCNDGEPQGPGAVISAPQSTASGTEGTDGPLGAARVTLHASVRVDQALDVEVTYPANANGTLNRGTTPWPVVVFVQGGLVPFARYRWIANHFATRGYVVAMPTHIADLAFFETDNAVLALRAVQRAAGGTGTLAGAIATDSAHRAAAVMGHSLGGVVAVREWIAGSFDAVALFASFPADGDPVHSRAGSPVLSLVGDRDVRKSPAQAYLDGILRFDPPRLFARIDGMNHYQWTDDASPAELAGDGASTRATADVRRDALRIVDLWLDATLKNDGTARAALAATSFPGTTLVQR